MRYTVEIIFRSWMNGKFKSVDPIIEGAKTIAGARLYELLCDESVLLFKITDNVNGEIVYSTAPFTKSYNAEPK